MWRQGRQVSESFRLIYELGLSFRFTELTGKAWLMFRES